MIIFLRRIIANRKGVTAVEFAFVAPVVLLMIFATIEISWFMLSSVILESAVREASRAGITGYTPDGMTRSAYIEQQVDDNILLMDKTKINFETTIYETFADINQPEPFTDSNANGNYDIGEPYTDVNGTGAWDADMGVAGVGGAGAVVVYRVTYPWQMMTPFIGQFFPNNGLFNITSGMVVRNEPF